MTVRPLPALTPETEPYWTSGADGVLRLPQCRSCSAILHPSHTTCPECRGIDLRQVDLAGTGVVLGVTVNHQMWLPGMTPPYVIAVVGLDEAPLVRLTTNLVVDDPVDAHVGMRVRPVFEHTDNVWIPLFEPTGEPDQPAVVTDRHVPARPPASRERFEHRSVLSGIGMSAVGRRLHRPPVSLAVEASLAAIADAGLELDDIDGIATYPGGMMGGGSGMSEGGVTALEEALRIRPTWFSGGIEVAGQGGAVIAAMLAVSAGLCRHVLCVRTVWESTHTDLMRTGRIDAGGGGRVGGDMQWRLPYGAASASNWIALNASQYFHRYGGDRTVLGHIAVNARKGAQLNPWAVYSDPLTLDDYFAARMVTTPFGLYDCDVPCDGSVAIIVSSADYAPDCPNGAVRIHAVGTQITERPSWDQGTLTHEPLVQGPSDHLWSRSELRQDDVDLALLYDGFTFNCLSWIEALGFCGPGEAADFIGDGSTIGLGGALPVNPHGGQLSAGRLHGYGFLHEAVTQLRGHAGARQVADAEVAVVSTGGGAPGGCFLLTAP